MKNIRFHTIATYTGKQLSRNFIFYLYATLLLGCFLLYTFLHTFLYNSLIDQHLLSSFTPYHLLFIIVIIQIVFIPLSVLSLWPNSRKVDSIEVLYTRPESNREYIFGFAYGIFRPYIISAIAVMTIMFILQFFGSPQSASIEVYLFYLFVLLLPFMIFLLGLSLTLRLSIQNGGLYIVILTIIIATLYFINYEVSLGIFDPTGLTQPTAFSEIAGHSSILRYTLERLFWLLIGGALIYIASIRFKRLSNSPREFSVGVRYVVVMLTIGVVIATVVIIGHNTDRKLRTAYREVFRNYTTESRATVLSHDITYHDKGSSCSVKSRITLCNSNRERLERIILYLNPSLEINDIYSNGTPLSFCRDNQAILIDNSLSPGDTLQLQISYEGRLDERICYLDVADSELLRLNQYRFNYKDNMRHRYLYSNLGVRSLFQQNNYTLLIPEALWYPVATPVIKPHLPLHGNQDFVHYSLSVSSKKTAVSQGKSIMESEITSFYPSHPLDGLSLMIGDYKRYSITVDSITYELYLTHGHEDMLRKYIAVGDSLPLAIATLRQKIEAKYNSDYPFEYFKLVEVPATFWSPYRPERGGSEYIQPEIVLFPERFLNLDLGVKRANNPHKSDEEISEKDIAFRAITEKLSFFFTYSAITYFDNGLFNPFYFKNATIVDNPRALSQMFFNKVYGVRSDSFPEINAIFNSLLKKYSETFDPMIANPLENIRQKAISYLSHNSLEEMKYGWLQGDIINQILDLKAADLRHRMFIRGVEPSDFDAFVMEYLFSHKFTNITLDSLSEKLASQHGVALREVIPQWRSANQLPVYRSKGCFTKWIADSSHTYIAADIFNNSDVDGVVSIEYSTMNIPSSNTTIEVPYKDNSLSKLFVIPAQQGKRIVIKADGMVMKLSITTHLSRNLPNKSSKSGRAIDEFKERYLPIEHFADPEGVIFVDNIDTAFHVTNISRFRKLNFRKQQRVLGDTQYHKFLSSREMQPGQWYHVVDGRLCGEEIASAYFARGSDGRAEAIWRVDITEPGLYRIEAFHAGIATFMPHLQKQIVFNEPIEKEYYMHYRLRSVGEDDIEIPIKLDLSLRGAKEGHPNVNNLGEFRLKAGTYEVILTNRGDPEQIIVADKIGFIRLNNNGEGYRFVW